MQKLTTTVIKRGLSTFLSCLISFASTAQKLPAVQQISLRTPENLRIDGKATEWSNKFQAYNSRTDFYYTIANNDNNLYVIIQAPAPEIIRRIINGGISLTINKSGKKKDREGPSITYPIFDRSNKLGVSFKNMPVIKPGVAATVMSADSFMNVTNRTMAAKSKLIMVTGVKDLDTLISVYNTDGIRAVALFDNKLVYTLELSISLKQLELSVNNPVKFSYQLMINEVVPNNANTFAEGLAISSDITARVAKMTSSGPPKRPEPSQAATYFWGEYTLVKK